MTPHLFSNNNLVSPVLKTDRESRQHRQGHRGMAVWMVGLSGAGKSSLAIEMDQKIFSLGWNSIVLDGDSIRQGLCKDLGFSLPDRSENLRRVAEVTKLFCEQGFIAITSFISPKQADREIARKILGTDFHECYVKASLASCEKRDPKGLYKKARAGQIKDFTGIDSPFEEPTDPQICVDTDMLNPDEGSQILWTFIQSKAALDA